MKLNLESIKDVKSWQDYGFQLPQYNIEEVRAKTRKEPFWLHFGPGNIFRAFPARLQDQLLDQGLAEKGVIVAETFNADSLDQVFGAYDNLSTAVTLKSDGSIDMRVVGCIAETVKAEQFKPTEWNRLKEIFRAPTLQITSLTITEKGYSIMNMDGDFTEQVKQEMSDPELQSKHAMGLICLLLYERYQAGELPLTLVSMDNISHNGTLLQNSILAYAKAWTDAEFMDKPFLSYLQNSAKIYFTWSMIDKITPRSSEEVAAYLLDRNYEDVGSLTTSTGPRPSFANAEETEYLVIEDHFTNGRPAWEHAGVIFTDRATVDLVETMKVSTCLNPLHTALAIFGCLLGYTRINAEMKDADLVNLIKGVGYKEGLPVVVDPGILDPREFLAKVIEERLPNPFLPDSPQRIAMDTSQKIKIRFGKTLSEYATNKPAKLQHLEFIPVVLAGWIRYLLAVDDQGNPIDLPSDPLLPLCKEILADLKFAEKNPKTKTILERFLSNSELFGVNLSELGLSQKIVDYFEAMNKGVGSVREVLANLPRI